MNKIRNLSRNHSAKFHQKQKQMEERTTDFEDTMNT